MLTKRIPSFGWSIRSYGKRFQSTQVSEVSDATSKNLNPLPSTETAAPNTHFKITLYRSAIALPKRYKATLVALGIHRRMQTVYHPHTPDIAGKILRVKELVHVENVPESSVRTKTEQRWERQPQPGFKIVRSWRDTTY